MKIAKVDPENMDLKIIDEAIDVLSSGGVVLYPTDTVYGLGANIFNDEAVKKVFDIKNRDYSKEISACFSSIEGILSVASIPSEYQDLVLKNLPGPFTFILNETPSMHINFAKNHKIGVRIPDNNISIAISKIFPITSTSANLAGEETLKTPQEILKQLDGDVDYVIDVGPLKSNIPSTVVDLTGAEPKILRRGAGIL